VVLDVEGPDAPLARVLDRPKHLFCLDRWNPTRGLPIVATNRRDTTASLITLAEFKKQRSAHHLADKSDVLLQRKGHAMKDRIALFVIVILPANFLLAISRVHLRIRSVLPRSTPLKAVAEPRAVEN